MVNFCSLVAKSLNIVSFHLQNYFCYSMYFVFTYTFYNQFFSFYKVYWDFDWDQEAEEQLGKNLQLDHIGIFLH